MNCIHVLLHIFSIFFFLRFLSFLITRPSTSPVSFALLLPFPSKLFFAVGHHLAREWHIVILVPQWLLEQMP